MRTWSPPIMFYSPETLNLGLQCAARVFCERQIGMDIKAQTVRALKIVLILIGLMNASRSHCRAWLSDLKRILVRQILKC